MENNIDKLLRNVLENHEEMPPSESWMHIHTEISKQNRRILTPVLVGLFLGILLISGIGISIYYASKSNENLVVSNVKTKPLFIPKNVQNSNLEGVLLAENNQVISKVLSSKILSPPLSMSPQTTMRLSSVDTGTHSQTTAESPSENSVQNVQEKPSKNDSVQYLSEINENSNLKINEIQPVELLAKSYVSTDLSEKMGGALMERIDRSYLDTNLAITDSVLKETKVQKFSLRHPILTIGTGINLDFWSITRNNPFYSDVINLPNPNYTENLIKIGIAWRLNNRLRIGASFVYNDIKLIGKDGYKLNFNYKFGRPGSFDEMIKVKSDNVALDKFYTSISPFGGNINVQSFPDQIQNNETVSFVNFQVPNSINTVSLSLNTQYTFLDKNRKNSSKLSYQIYGLTDFIIQRQIKYAYKESAIALYSIGGVGGYSSHELNVENSHLQNASEFVFGLRAGVGFRYQFAKKWDFYVEGSGQHSLNNWVKSNNIKTFQRAVSLQAGINLNL